MYEIQWEAGIAQCPMWHCRYYWPTCYWLDTWHWFVHVLASVRVSKHWSKRM